MGSMSLELWLAIGAIMAFCTVGCLHVLACMLRDHARTEALRREVLRLQAEYAKRLQEMEKAAAAAGIALESTLTGDFDIVGEPAAQAA